jgi:ATP-dependent Clp protease ATP-binding subunit ClpB
LGSSAILDGIQEDGSISEGARSEVDKLLKASFRPEFLNRLDEIVFFKPLTKSEVGKIVGLLAEDLKKRLEEKQLYLTLTDSAVEYIIDSGYDPVYGARPLKRYMQHTLETMLAKSILSNRFRAGDKIVVDANANGLFIR